MPQVECLEAPTAECDSIQQRLQGLCSTFNQFLLQGSWCKSDWSVAANNGDLYDWREKQKVGKDDL